MKLQNMCAKMERTVQDTLRTAKASEVRTQTANKKSCPPGKHGHLIPSVNTGLLLLIPVNYDAMMA